MNIRKTAIAVLLAVAFLGGPLAAQSSGSTGWFVEFGGTSLVPMGQPAGLGGAVAGGFAARDFNILLRPEVMVVEPGAASRLLIVPALLFEVKFSIVPGFLTLLPYINAGVIGGKVRKAVDGSLSNQTYTYYAEAGIGAELIMTHELSVVPRLGVASALLYSDFDSGNYSGLTASLAARYTFGRSKSLDY